MDRNLFLTDCTVLPTFCLKMAMGKTFENSCKINIPKHGKKNNKMLDVLYCIISGITCTLSFQSYHNINMLIPIYNMHPNFTWDSLISNQDNCNCLSNYA